MTNFWAGFCERMILNEKEAAWAQDYLESRSATFGWAIKSVLDAPDSPALRTLEIWGDENNGGNVDEAAEFLQEYLARFAPSERATIEFCMAASDPEPGAFGGGACIITPKRIYWMGTARWLSHGLSCLDLGLKPVDF